MTRSKKTKQKRQQRKGAGSFRFLPVEQVTKKSSQTVTQRHSVRKGKKRMKQNEKTSRVNFLSSSNADAGKATGSHSVEVIKGKKFSPKIPGHANKNKQDIKILTGKVVKKETKTKKKKTILRKMNKNMQAKKILKSLPAAETLNVANEQNAVETGNAYVQHSIPSGSKMIVQEVNTFTSKSHTRKKNRNCLVNTNKQIANRLPQGLSVNTRNKFRSGEGWKPIPRSKQMGDICDMVNFTQPHKKYPRLDGKTVGTSCIHKLLFENSASENLSEDYVVTQRPKRGHQDVEIVEVKPYKGESSVEVLKQQRMELPEQPVFADKHLDIANIRQDCRDIPDKTKSQSPKLNHQVGSLWRYFVLYI